LPYSKNRHSQAMEIIKQLYDIDKLFDSIKDFGIVKRTFKEFAIIQLGYRGLEQNPGIVLDDIFQTALCISTRGIHGKGNFTALQNGISQVKAFIFAEYFHIEKAIAYTSKAAYLSKLIEYNENTLYRFSNPMEIKDWIYVRDYF